MRSAADPRETRGRVALFMALAALAQVAETLLPTPAPWLRLGLGNAFALAALSLWGFRAGAFVALGKVIVGGLIGGKLFMPGFFLALGGSAASITAMALVRWLPLGFAGVSVIGAGAHSAAQLFLARWLILKTPAVWALAPVIGVLAVGAGIATGIAAAWLCRVVTQEETAGL
jgi:heptaprenyl diphosphate synthase